MKIRFYLYHCSLTVFSLVILLVSCSEKRQTLPLLYYINSYHQGYGSSDDVMRGIVNNLPDSTYQLKTVFMDSKRNSSSEHLLNISAAIFEEIRQLRPDVIIASDDNAVKFIVKRYLSGTDYPVVFCGVNWSADQYQLSRNNVCGMLEVIPLNESLAQVKKIDPDAKRLLILSENTNSEQKNKTLLDALFRNAGFVPSYQLVDSFEGWKTCFIEGNQKYDAIYLPTNGAIKDWNTNEAESLVLEVIKVPVFTCDDFMMPYAVFGYTKIAEEQGAWAAMMAREIVNGKNPSDIPITRNKQSKVYINTTLAERTGFIPNESFIRKAEKVK